MRFNAEMEAVLLEQIEQHPDIQIILPPWAYRSGDQPVIYIGGKRLRLVRHLYEKAIGPLPREAGLAPRPESNERNVNPHFFAPTKTRHTRVTCPNNHTYTEEDMTPKGHRCRQCQREKNLGTPTVAEINAAKTVCPQNHPLVGDNLLNLKNGRRRCRQCNRDQQAARRAREKEAR